MAYADYSFYTTEYKGQVVPAASFEFTAARASEILDALTFGHITNAGENVKLACCVLCDCYYTNELSHDASIKSEKVGSYDVTYADKTERNALYRNAIAWYLGNMGLLYRGQYDDEH